ncbi:OLC1v1025920C1 [Oldenlandia corymbosa var. corymbosa]|uniref:OLC1v1025920C1 n=1 Tax=Oldenlandia corymbosa var. corymbosa TaxID=529605 RepID=A0AAV1C5U2_OLDCO|nr:OLC1v1025920C1 [Oldenlandia corymbosa var. corymbosa]
MSNYDQFLFTNGVLFPPADTPPVATVLQAYPGAYTTTRTHHNGAEILFWERHLSRLSNSMKLLLRAKPELLFKTREPVIPFVDSMAKSFSWDSLISGLVNDYMGKALSYVTKERCFQEEMSITTLVCGNLDVLEEDDDLDEERIARAFDVYLHFGRYVPRVFGADRHGNRLAVVGHGRDVANAKYSDWVRLRKNLERLRPPSTSELLLSNDGDHILEGCLTNFFVVCCKDGVENTDQKKYSDFIRFLEVQTAPLKDGVLPGVIRQAIIEVCSNIGIPLREVSPSWSQNKLWKEAFTTNSLRLLEHAETIMVPSSWDALGLKSWMDVIWEEKQFEVGPGRITSIIQKEVMKMADTEGYPVVSLKQ